MPKMRTCEDLQRGFTLWQYASSILVKLEIKVYIFQMFIPDALEAVLLVPFWAKRLLLRNLTAEDNDKVHVVVYGLNGEQGKTTYILKINCTGSLKNYILINDVLLNLI